jgi:hypothetical protein
MTSGIFMNQDEITFDPGTHQYFNKEKTEYSSVTRLLKGIQVPFDRQGMSLRMAQSIAADLGVSVEQAQSDILQEWEDKKNSSINKGDYVHDGLEKYVLTGEVMEAMEKPVAFMQNILKQYYRFYSEVILFSHRYRVAGRTDLVLQRQKNRDPVLDLTDYKTNEAKGICFDSISRKDGIKHYNKFLLPPLDYLEDCNYNIYSLQLSIYAFLIMDSLKTRIGKLGIIFFDNQFDATYIPVPFMYQEAKMICEMNIEEKKSLPITDSIFHDECEKGVYPIFDPNNVKDDW